MSDQVEYGPHVWGREGFVGRSYTTLRRSDLLQYRAATGKHVPRRLNLHDIVPADSSNREALPTTFMTSEDGTSLFVSARSEAMPFAFRNVEADEVHFVAAGSFRYWTDCGVIDAHAGDFLVIPRALTYQAAPLEAPTLRIILEQRREVLLCSPLGMINKHRHLRHPLFENSDAPRDETRRLILKSFDGITEFEMESDPLSALGERLDGVPPVWAVNLRDISRISFFPGGGSPPAAFAGTTDGAMLFYSLSSRPTGRQPMHYNADYDELSFYFAGPAPRGDVEEPGTMVWIPKGVGHHGPSEDVSNGEFWVWLVEITSTMRFSEEALAVADLVDTEGYGRLDWSLHRQA